MKTVLLIDDNLLIIDNLTEAFEMEGYRVLTAKNGDDGIAMANSQRPDLIIAEIMMGGMDGFDLLHRINTTPKLNAIPFVFCTTRCEKSDKSKALQLGASDYITKPFELEYLFKAAKKLIVHD